MAARHWALELALMDALTAGLGLGYLAHQYREALVANSAVLGLALVLLFLAVWAIRLSVRALSRANARMGAIFAEELRDRPSPRPH